MTKQQMEEIWRGKIICATHFNYWGYKRESPTRFGWLRKRWDAAHDDPAIGNWLRRMRSKARTATLRYLARDVDG